MKKTSRPWIDRWVYVASGSTPSFVTPPELDIPLDNALNVTLNVDCTGVGPGCSNTVLVAERSAATTDQDGAWQAIFPIIISAVARSRTTYSMVFGQNNPDQTQSYLRGLMRFHLNNSTGPFAFVRLRIWVDIEYADGTHLTEPNFLPADVVAPDADPRHPQLWFDDLVVLDDLTAGNCSQWSMPAAMFIPMNNNTKAYYTVETAGSGAGTGGMEFERCAAPTEKDSLWQAMNSSGTVAISSGYGVINRAFGDEVPAGDHAPRGYQRITLKNTAAAATGWVAMRTRIWAHLSGS